jgi:hypothetical protein
MEGISTGRYWKHQLDSNMKKILTTGLIAGCILFVAYDNPLFNSDGGRDVLFYMHAFIISFALSWFWDRFKLLFKGSFIMRGFEFGFVYSIIALLPVMWISFSSLDITVVMVSSWFLYGLAQAIIAGLVFAKINP